MEYVTITVGLIGNTNTGKTSIAEYMSGLTIDFHTHEPTLGTNLSIIHLNNDTIHLRLLDITGMKRYSHLIYLYAPVCDIIVLTYSLDNPDSLTYIETFYNKNKHASVLQDKKFIILATKADKKYDITNKENGQLFADSINAFYIDVSVKTEYNLDNFLFLLKLYIPEPSPVQDTLVKKPNKKCNIF